MGCGGSKAEGAFPKIERKPFKLTKVPDVDELFSSVEEPCNSVCDMSDALNDGNDSINTLRELSEFAEMLGDAAAIGDILKIVFNDLKKNKIVPTFEFSDGSVSLGWSSKPDGYLGKAIDAIATLIDACKSLLETAPGIAGQLAEVAKQAQEFPDKIKEMAEAAGLGGMDLVNAGRNLGNNVKQLVAFPVDITNLVQAVKDLMGTLQEVCGGGGGGGGGDSGAAEKAAPEEKEEEEEAEKEAEKEEEPAEQEPEKEEEPAEEANAEEANV